MKIKKLNEKDLKIGAKVILRSPIYYEDIDKIGFIKKIEKSEPIIYIDWLDKKSNPTYSWHFSRFDLIIEDTEKICKLK